jgi:hypothetical protein
VRAFGAIDNIFLAQLILEEGVDDRPSTTRKAVVEARLPALGAEILSLVNDRATAFMQLTAHELERLGMPDGVHDIYDVVQSSTLALGGCVRHTHHALPKAEEALTLRHTLIHGAPERPEAKAEVEAKHAEVRRWEECRARIEIRWRRSRSRCLPSALRTQPPRPPRRSKTLGRGQLRRWKCSSKAMRCSRVPTL